MPKDQIQCELARVRVTGPEGEIWQDEIPAYTVPQPALRKRVDEIMEDYCKRSTATANQVSLADFILYLLTFAATDPRVMD